MQAAPVPASESRRLAALGRLRVLDTPPEARFDAIVSLVALTCNVPVSTLTLIDAHRQWFKARTGIEVQETSRLESFCGHTIVHPEGMFVEDTHKDDRFRDNPFVTSEPHIRFYAGVPLVTRSGDAVGTLCAIDTIPRRLSLGQREALAALARQATLNLESREDAFQLEHERLRRLAGEDRMERMLAVARVAFMEAEALRMRREQGVLSRTAKRFRRSVLEGVQAA